MEVFYWVTAVAALVGVWLNIHGQRACFAIWAVTNATWTVVDYLQGIYAQAALQAATVRPSLSPTSMATPTKGASTRS